MLTGNPAEAAGLTALSTFAENFNQTPFSSQAKNVAGWGLFKAD